MPLFEDWSDEWAYLAVHRLEPIEEKGYLGQLEIGADEVALRNQFGGGKYLIQAKNSSHQVKNQRTIEIAGDPLFMTDEAEHRYRARRTPGGPRAAAAAAAAPGIGLTEIMTLMQTLQQSAQAQLQQQLEAQREERRRQEEADRRRDEERRREEERREDARRQAAKEEAERRRDEEKAERERNREHQASMLQLVLNGQKQGGQPIEAFMAGITTAIKLAGGRTGEDEDEDQGEGEDADPWVATVKSAVQGIADALGGKKETPASSPSSSSSADEDKDVRITGPLADHVKKFATLAKKKGKNVDALLASAVDVMAKKLEGEDDNESSSSSSGGASVTDLDAARKKAAKQIQAAGKKKKAAEGEQQPPQPPPAPPAS